MVYSVQVSSPVTDLPFSALQAFAAVAEHRGFRRAAAEKGVSPSALSHAIRGLEDQLAVRLLNRSTRSVALTEAGKRLLDRLRPALDEVRDALGEAKAGTTEPQGTVRLSVPRLAAALVLGPRLAGFAALHPHVEVHVTVDDAVTDIVAGGFDAGMRFGERLERDMIAVPVGPPVRLIAAASPAYLARHSAPSHPRDLARHQCLRYRYPGSGAVYAWEF